jgi:ketosteroid isomerase-like protein
LAQKLFHPNLSMFGTESLVAIGRVQAENLEWREAWKNQLSFNFDYSSASIIPCGDMTIVSVLWEAQALLHGAPAQKGRASVILGRFENGKILAVHLHLSRKP